MHSKLIIRAFEKAREEAQNKGVNRPSNNSLAKILSDFIFYEMNTPIGERRLRDYYNASINTELTNESDININQLKVVIGLCHYLDYENYEAFVSQTSSKPKKKAFEEGVWIFNKIKVKYENRITEV